MAAPLAAFAHNLGDAACLLSGTEAPMHLKALQCNVPGKWPAWLAVFTMQS